MDIKSLLASNFFTRLAYSWMLPEYESVFSDEEKIEKRCPAKKVEHGKVVDGICVETDTVMWGTTMSGAMAVKNIYVNDETAVTMEDIALYNKDKQLLAHYKDEGITPFRCGIMTCVAIREMMKMVTDVNFAKIGFIGNGRTNQANCKAIKAVFGMNQCIIRGSARNRGKNAEAFKGICEDVVVDDTDDLRYLNECDIVVVCTSAYTKEEQISTKDLSKPRLIIALDSGYLLDESFRRECESFTDHVRQLEAHYKEEFAFDNGNYKLHPMSVERPLQTERAVVYMYGIGLADAVITELIYKAVSA